MPWGEIEVARYQHRVAKQRRVYVQSGRRHALALRLDDLGRQCQSDLQRAPSTLLLQQQAIAGAGPAQL